VVSHRESLQYRASYAPQTGKRWVSAVIGENLAGEDSLVSLPRDTIIAMAHDDLRLEEWDPTAWSQLPPGEAAKYLLDHVLAEAAEADAWYRRHKGRRATYSRTIRAVVILFGAVGGFAPIVAGLRVGAITAENAAVINQLGFLCIGVAASLLAFDRYFGVSTGWLRYVAALSAIQRQRAEFLFQWSELLREISNSPTPDDLSRFIECARSFRLTIIDVIARETEAWNTEFRSSFADLERLVRAEQEHVPRTESSRAPGPAGSEGKPSQKSGNRYMGSSGRQRRAVEP
jgi:hypothetical protein